MDDEHQALAYAQADFSRSDQALVEVILRLIRQEPREPRRLLDLGCGPGNLTFPLAEALPEVAVLGLDGAGAMLGHALRRQRNEPDRWPRLQFIQATLPLSSRADLRDLPAMVQPPFQVVVCNSLLHHLHDPQVLWRSILELGSRGTLVVLRDLRRPDDPRELEDLVSRHVSDAPAILQRDYRSSLQAAFRPTEVRRQLQRAGLDQLQVLEVEDRYLDVVGVLP
ncbi:MAG: class I SAM-dependent methyltransferase [Cyanobium sp.]